VGTTGWTQHPFRADHWTDIADFLGGMTARHPRYGYMTAIVDSVITSNSTSLLAGCTSMHDLVVVPVPIPEPHYSMIRVRAPGSLRGTPPPGTVVIEHRSPTGDQEQIHGPTVDAVPLFWRFVREKYGIEPDNAPRP
jgi:hypothetical protein